MFDYQPSTFQRLAYSDGEIAVPPISFRASRFAQGHDQPQRAHSKRLEDIVIALLGLAIMALPMLCITILIRLTSRGPALFRQQRVGLHGHPFQMLKFRTMHRSCTAQPCRQATRHDPRVTWIGAFLRHTSCDELPQLFNVLVGSMSIVGPRPHAPGTCAAGRTFEGITQRYNDRHAVKPGMTGLAQVRGWRGETDTEEKLLRRLDSDLEYIATRSTGLDLLIICRTIVTVLRMRNAY
jgi:lipopolysaccharide/colanic/teichoic acid biosynthesis glycosyltransferase